MHWFKHIVGRLSGTGCCREPSEEEVMEQLMAEGKAALARIRQERDIEAAECPNTCDECSGPGEAS